MKKILFICLYGCICIFLNACACSSQSKDSDKEVYNSGYDSSVWQVEYFLKQNLKDPKSYEGINWSEVVERADGTFVVRHKYRAKNSLGGYVINNQVFYLNASGDVTDYSDFTEY